MNSHPPFRRTRSWVKRSAELELSNAAWLVYILGKKRKHHKADIVCVIKNGDIDIVLSALYAMALLLYVEQW